MIFVVVCGLSKINNRNGFGEVSLTGFFSGSFELKDRKNCEVVRRSVDRAKNIY